jgi:hypothetical protein
MVIRPPPGDDGDFMAFFRQRRRQVSKMLRRGNDVGIKRLIEQENFQKIKLNVPSAGFLI